MANFSTEAAIIETLASYLLAQVPAQTGLGASTVVAEWPEPTTDLQLSATGVAIAVIRAGAPRPQERLGPPRISRVIPGTYPACTVRYDMGIVEQPITIGMWAMSRQMRDDADYVIGSLLNKPYWSTVSPIVSTTSSLASKKGDTILTPASMTDILPGMILQIDSGGALENVNVDSLTFDQRINLVKPLNFAHAASVALVQVAGRNVTLEDGLQLRAANYFNAVVRYDFQAPSTMDSPARSQLQEWVSLRQGIGMIRRYLEVPGVQQGHLHLSSQAGSSDLSGFTPSVPIPKTFNVF